MKKSFFPFVLFFLLLSFQGFSQDTKSPALNTAESPKNMNLSGPRVGVTFLQGSVADKAKEKYSINPIITQLGWQFETRLFFSQNGAAGLVEVIPLIGALDQGKFVPSVNLMTGIRTKRGFEVGTGINATLNSVGIVFAAGGTFRFDGFFVPLNLVYVPAQNGGRISIMTGFTIKQRD